MWPKHLKMFQKHFHREIKNKNRKAKMQFLTKIVNKNSLQFFLTNYLLC